MEIINDFLTNNYVLAIGAVALLGFVAKLLVGYFAKDKNIIVPASEIIDEVTENIIDKIEDNYKAKELANPVVKEGIAIKPKRTYKKKKVVTEDGEL